VVSPLTNSVGPSSSALTNGVGPRRGANIRELASNILLKFTCVLLLSYTSFLPNAEVLPPGVAEFQKQYSLELD